MKTQLQENRLSNILKISFDCLGLTENYFLCKTRSYFHSHHLTETQDLKFETIFYGPGFLYSKYGDIEIRVKRQEHVIYAELDIRGKRKIVKESIDTFYKKLLIDFRDFIQDKNQVELASEIQIIEYSHLNRSVEAIWDKDFTKEEKLFWNFFLALVAFTTGFVLPLILKKSGNETIDIKDYISAAGKVFTIYLTFVIIQVQRNRSISSIRFKKILNHMKNLNSFFNWLLVLIPFVALYFFFIEWRQAKLGNFDFFFLSALSFMLGTYSLKSSKKIYKFNREMFDEPDVKNLKKKYDLRILELSFTIAIGVMSLLFSQILSILGLLR